MILDAAAELVESEGIRQLSMERVALHAQISKSLIYKYFDNIQELLRTLLERESRYLRKTQFAAAEAAGTFEELVRGITKTYLRNISRKGLLLERLQADPALSETNDPTALDRDIAVEYLSKIVNKNFDLPMDTARAITEISFGVPSAAGAFLLRHDVDRDELEDITVAMIVGSINGIRNEYMIRKNKLKR
ncbi:MAG: TetR/AcrR family transcriptional regulator [Pseudomonadota bacterium]